MLTCFGLSRLISIMLIVWLLTSRKSEYIYSWRNCQVGVSVLHVDATNILFVQVFYRAELRLTGGDLPTSRLLPWPQCSQGDIWRFQRKSQVRTLRLYMIHLCFLGILPFNEWTVHYKPSWAFRRKHRIEMHESYSESCRQKNARMSRGNSGREQARAFR